MVWDNLSNQSKQYKSWLIPNLESSYPWNIMIAVVDWVTNEWKWCMIKTDLQQSGTELYRTWKLRRATGPFTDNMIKFSKNLQKRNHCLRNPRLILLKNDTLIQETPIKFNGKLNMLFWQNLFIFCGFLL